LPKFALVFFGPVSLPFGAGTAGDSSAPELSDSRPVLRSLLLLALDAAAVAPPKSLNVDDVDRVVACSVGLEWVMNCWVDERSGHVGGYGSRATVVKTDRSGLYAFEATEIPKRRV
jgi:hypothetical protein